MQKRKRILARWAVALALASASSLMAQTFEIVSVKTHDPARDGEEVRPACIGNRFVAVSPVDLVIRFAYDLDAAQFKEFSPTLPEWARSPIPTLPIWARSSTAFHVEAKADMAVPEIQCRKMVQSLLLDRFKFSAHWDTPVGDVYNLVVAKGGHKMAVVADGDQSRGVYETRNGRLVTPFAPGMTPRPGLTMDELSKFLSMRLNPQVPVIDKTGLEGLYKITLAYSAGGADLSAPDIFSAVERQLGLKLERAKGPVPRLIFDRIEKPTEN